MSSDTQVKATIKNLDEGGEEIKCLFNPNEYTFSKRNDWKRKELRNGCDCRRVDRSQLTGGVS